MCIFGFSGLLLWEKSFEHEGARPLKGSPIDSLVRERMVQERGTRGQHEVGGYVVKWVRRENESIAAAAVFDRQVAWHTEYIDILLPAVLQVRRE